jgi:hypothetical protein
LQDKKQKSQYTESDQSLQLNSINKLVLVGIKTNNTFAPEHGFDDLDFNHENYGSNDESAERRFGDVLEEGSEEKERQNYQNTYIK